MTEAKLTYLGPLSGEQGPARATLASRIPWVFVAIVVFPTLLAAVYFLLIASPRYVSEARFIVRAQAKDAPSSLGIALQGVGLASTQTDAFAVHEYIRSRDGLAELQGRYDVKGMLNASRGDIFSAIPKPWQGASREDFYRGFQKFIVVGYDSTNGMSTLRVEAFRPQDAQLLANGLLAGGEKLVNRLNVRASQTAVVEAEAALAEAEDKLADVQSRLTVFRNRERFIDPSNVATESSELIGGLLLSEAQLSAERSEIAAGAPQSPQLSAIDSRLAAIRAQIEAARNRVVGSAGSLAPKIGEYETLAGERELAARTVASASASLNSAQQDARRQQLYLERVVNPGLPDKPAEPKRWLEILKVFATLLLFYGVGWLIWAGIREHRQG